MLMWLKRCVMRPGREIVHWPARDLREDLLIVDVSRLSANFVGVKRRVYGVYRRVSPPPEYPREIKWLGFWRTLLGSYLPPPKPHECRRCRYDLTGNTSGVCPECGTPIPAKAKS